jgi:hypothetical protein
MIVKRRALCPHYYAGGDGELRTAKTGYEVLLYSPTLFLLASNAYNGLIQLKAEAPPAYLPNAADVIVVSCAAEKYMEAQMVFVLGDSGEHTLADSGIPT